MSPVREKNASPGIDFVMQAKISQSRASEKSLHRQDDDVSAMLEFVWQKIQEKHKSLTNAFRFLDYKSKGKIKKSDFALGLEKMKILLARADSDRLFNHLDKNSTGFLTFAQFCTIVEETSSRVVDPYRLQEIEQAINEKVRRERQKEAADKQQE